jgi:hypothetical protein
VNRDLTGVREIDTRPVDRGLVDRAANHQGVLTGNYLTRLADITVQGNKAAVWHE